MVEPELVAKVKRLMGLLVKVIVDLWDLKTEESAESLSLLKIRVSVVQVILKLIDLLVNDDKKTKKKSGCDEAAAAAVTELQGQQRSVIAKLLSDEEIKSLMAMLGHLTDDLSMEGDEDESFVIIQALVQGMIDLMMKVNEKKQGYLGLMDTQQDDHIREKCAELYQLSIGIQPEIRGMFYGYLEAKGCQLPTEPFDTLDYEAAEREATLSFVAEDIQGFGLMLPGVSSSNLEEKKSAAKAIRGFLESNPSFVHTLLPGTPNAVTRLVNSMINTPLLDVQLLENMIAIIVSISAAIEIRKLLGRSGKIIKLLNDALTSGTEEAKRNAAAAFSLLSTLGCNKRTLVFHDALHNLVEVYEKYDASSSIVRDAISGITNLCEDIKNRRAAIKERVVGIIVSKMKKREAVVDDSLRVLCLLSSEPEAIDDMVNLGAVRCLLDLTKELTSEASKEECVVILWEIFCRDKTQLKDDGEQFNATLTELVQSEASTPKAKKTATKILAALIRDLKGAKAQGGSH